MILKTNTSNKEQESFNFNLTRVLVCPVSGGPLYYDHEEFCLVSKAAKIKFPIRDGIPILIASEATPLFND